MNTDTIRDLAKACTVITGLGGWFVALASFLNDFNWTGAGVGLTAAAIAFGLLSARADSPRCETSRLTSDDCS